MSDKPRVIKVPNFQTERKFSAWFSKLLREEFDEKIKVVNVSGTGYGSNGVSDLIVCFYGIFFAIELKMDGKELTKLQMRFCMDIDRAGGRTLAPVTPSTALQAIDYLRTIEQYRKGAELVRSMSREEVTEVVAEAKEIIANEEAEDGGHD